MPAKLLDRRISAENSLRKRCMVLAAAVVLISTASVNNEPASALIAHGSGVANSASAATAVTTRSARKAAAAVIKAEEPSSAQPDHLRDTSTERAPGRGKFYPVAALLILLTGLTRALTRGSLARARDDRIVAAR